MIPNNTMTEGELQQAASSIKEIETNSKLEIGKILCEVKKRTEHGRFEEWIEKEVEYSYTHAKRLMKMFKLYGQKGPMGPFSESQMFELAKTSDTDRPFLEQAITEIQEEQPTIQVPTTSMRSAKALFNGTTEVDLEDLKEALILPKTQPYKSNVDYSKSFTTHITAAARAVWEGDYSANELAIALKPDSHQAFIELSNLQEKLERVWTELYKEMSDDEPIN